jgi:hypothetical protein
MGTPPLDDTTGDLFEDKNIPPNSPPRRTWPPESKISQLASAASSNSLLRQEHHTPFLLASAPISSPEEPYMSTTDEEDTMSFDHQPLSGSSNFTLDSQATAQSFSRRRSHRSEPTATHPAPPASVQVDIDEDEDEWDYSETEWWGWVILIATWTVFVVVMGSCFGVWSWAWDVGETPYAPPDLEDDDTLPITGYYPALMVCTAVMSWVWVVVAWVGMKYFRHSKSPILADDG